MDERKQVAVIQSGGGEARRGFRGVYLSWIFLFCVTTQAFSQTPVPRRTPGDMRADLVLGQAGFGNSTPNQPTSLSLFNVSGVVVDKYSVPQRLYIFDGGNNRILGFSDLSQAGCSGTDINAHPTHGADIVLGQPDYSTSSCNRNSTLQASDHANSPVYVQPDAFCLCTAGQGANHLAESHFSINMAVDPSGNLYVPDVYNNRVLRYDKPGPGAGQGAAYVWGQSGFTSGYIDTLFTSCGAPTNAKLCFKNFQYAGVAVDGDYNLWVADAGNGRVLRFPNPDAPSPGVPGTTADLVLGQADFGTTAVPASINDITTLSRPTAIRVGPTGKVYVTDQVETAAGWKGRLLVYTAPYYNNKPPDQIQTVYLSNPVGLEFNPDGDLWVMEFHQAPVYGQVVLLDKDTLQPKSALMQNRAWDGTSPLEPTWCDPLPPFRYQVGTAGPCRMPDAPWGGVGVDVSGNLYLSGRTDVNDVWRFPAPTPYATTTTTTRSADLSIMKPRHVQQRNEVGSVGLNSNYSIGVAVARPVPPSSPGQIIVSDSFRMRYWNIPQEGVTAIPDGCPADGFAGVADESVSILEMGDHFIRIREDQADPQHLWVIRNTIPAKIEVYLLPLSPANRLPFYTLPLDVPVLGIPGETTGYNGISGIAPSPDAGFLWVGDRARHRLLRIRDPLTNPVVDIVLGQKDLVSSACNQGGVVNVPVSGACSLNPTANSLYNPGALRLDRHGNLFVVDFGWEPAGNRRMLRWNACQFPSNHDTCLFSKSRGEADSDPLRAAAVYGTGGSFTAAGAGVGYFSGPFEPAFDPREDWMVLGMSTVSPSRFPWVFPTLDTSASDASVQHLDDYVNLPFSTTFDEEGNLYVADMDWNRVMVYFKPDFGPRPTQSATPLLCLVPTLTPSATLTPTPTLSLTNTSSPTETDTCTPSWTSTSTTSPTWTETPTPSLTPTSTSTSTVSATCTPTPTRSATSSSTPTPGAGETPHGGFYPHPVKGGCRVHFRGFVHRGDTPVLSFFTMSSRRVAHHTLSAPSVGWAEWEIELTDVKGTPLSNGIYFAVFEAGGKRVVYKLVVVR